MTTVVVEASLLLKKTKKKLEDKQPERIIEVNVNRSIPYILFPYFPRFVVSLDAIPIRCLPLLLNGSIC